MVKNNITIENARIMFRNFAGDKQKNRGYNEDRKFSVVLDPDLAKRAGEDGWPVRVLPARNEEDDDLYIMDVKVQFGKFPPQIENRTCLIVDPMLATGGSLTAAIQFLRDAGVRDIRALTLVSCPEGVKAVLDFDPDVRLYTCSIDRELNENAYILPGLGDAGDRIYGTR